MGGAVPNPGKGLSIAGMVLGIVAAALACAWYLSIPCGIVGLVLSILGRKKSQEAGAPTGMATAGMILSIIGIGLGIIIGAIFWSMIAGLIGMGKAMQTQMQRDANMKSLIDLIRMF